MGINPIKRLQRKLDERREQIEAQREADKLARDKALEQEYLRYRRVQMIQWGLVLIVAILLAIAGFYYESKWGMFLGASLVLTYGLREILIDTIMAEIASEFGCLGWVFFLIFLATDERKKQLRQYGKERRKERLSRPK